MLSAPRGLWWQHLLDRPLLLALVGLVALLTLAFAPIRPASGSVTISAPPAATLVVADLRGQALVLLDPAAPEEARRIPLPGGPHELLRLPDGRIAVSLEQSGRLAIVDRADGAVETIDLGGVPHGLALQSDPQGPVLLVTDRESSVVRRIALSGWYRMPPRAAGQWPHAVVALPDGGLAVANAADDSLTIGAQTVTVSSLPETVALSPDGSRIATAGAYGGAVEVFDTAGERLRRSEVGGRPVRVAFAPDGRTLAVSLSAGGAIALIGEDGDVRRVAVAGVPDGLAFASGGRFLYGGDVAGGVVSVIDTERGEVIDEFTTSESAGALLVLPARAAP